jgi:hypothetical protein
MLQKLNFKPGFNKMVTDSGGEYQLVLILHKNVL